MGIYINFSLYSNQELLINRKINCEYINEELSFIESGILNKIDLNNKVYIRENEEYIININFLTNVMKIYLKNEKLEISVTIKGNFVRDNNTIHIKYTFEDNDIEIIIQLL